MRAGTAQPDHPRWQRRQWEAMQAWDAFLDFIERHSDA
jgi:hypothetical protein